ncbi:hypothetical protein Val02_10360 [Virgisporangium aliadipatigenens]|uniref:DUF7779 domain-containing protein n=1 Tax=Virgisporangium aliadipatigenens TaxID=741659 RepID=A0A8J3YHL5_9ACTN|nr:tetratricopeptide repeat protein [Virgisporangium aliadipatigenens]GIJ44150.1 hypothetical protein Val02_10360 [Virgisporangium aliadipatigenens]
MAPTVAAGRTVVTSRRRDNALLSGRQVIDVDVFTPEEATAYLRTKLADRPQRLVEADELAADLGYLPLALAQAAAYIADHGLRMTCAAYRERLADQRRRLHELAPDALPDQHLYTVAATWELSITRADKHPPTGLARPILEIAALLDPNAIPLDLFTTAAVTDYCAARLDRPVDAEDTLDALHLLHRFGLLTVDESTDAIRIHALLQRAVREATAPTAPPGLARAAADALLERWPAVERADADAQSLRTSTEALHATGGRHLWSQTDGAHGVLFRAGHSLGECGLVTAAAGYFRRLHAMAADRLGPDHTDSLAARYYLAYWQGGSGDHAGSAAAFRELLKDQLRLLGPDHLYTLTTRGLIAYWQGHAGDPSGAVTALQQVLNDHLRVLGPDHPNTLVIRLNLAFWQGSVGDPSDGAAIQTLVSEQLRVHGPDHPNTLAARTIAYWQGRTDDPIAAATGMRDLLSDQARVHGPDHPAVLAARAVAAQLQGEAGDPAGAVAAFEELVDDQVRVFGPGHPDVLTTRRIIDFWSAEVTGLTE